MKYKMDSLTMMTMLAISGGLSSLKVEQKEPKKCLRCNEEHYHNNSFCSAECCKAYRLKIKQAKTTRGLE